MPANVGAVKIEISVDDKGSVKIRQLSGETIKAGDVTEKSFKKAGRSVDDFSNKLRRAAQIVAAWKMAQGLMEVIQAASDLQETTAKFETVFRNQMETANRFEKELTRAYAMSTEEARRHLAAMQDLLVPMGMNEAAAARLSGEIVKLSADLGSFNNLPTAQVMADIQSALVGNYETMKKYGVVLNATTVQQKALDMGLAATKDQLTAAQKAHAAYTLIVEGSTAAIGDMARTSDSYANTVKRMDAAWQDFSAKFGERFLPVATEVVRFLADHIPEAFETARLVALGFMDGVEEGWINIEYGAKAMWAGIKTSWSEGVLSLQEAWSEWVALVAEGLDYIPLSDKLVGPMRNYVRELQAAIAVERERGTALDEVRTQWERALEVHDRTIEAMRQEIGATSTIAEASAKAAQARVSSQAQVQAAVQQTGVVTSANVDKWIADVNRTIAAETEQAAKIGELAMLEQQYRDAAHKVRLVKENEILERLKFAHAGYLEYRQAQIDQERAQLEALGVDEELIEQNTIERRKALYEEYYAYLQEQMEGYQSAWESMNEEMEQTTQTASENIQSIWEQMATAWGDGTRGNGYVGRIVEAWAKGEDAKQAVTRTANDMMASLAGQLVQAIWNAMIGKVATMIGVWTGLGAAESGTEGESTSVRLGNITAYIDAAITALLGAKSAGDAFRASGGWIAAHPWGGWIREGSGIADDVFLGRTGNVRHWGMGGEFVVRKGPAQKYADLLQQINRDVGYAYGGPLQKPFENDTEGFETLVDTIMANGIKAWWEEYLRSRNIYTAIMYTLYYFGSLFAGAFGGKMAGQNIEWAEGGQLPLPVETLKDPGGGEFSTASFFGDFFKHFWDMFRKWLEKQFNTFMRFFQYIDIWEYLGWLLSPVARLYTWIRRQLGRDIIEEIFDPARKDVRRLLEILIDPGNFDYKSLLPFSSARANAARYPDKPWKPKKPWEQQRPDEPEKPNPLPGGPTLSFLGAFASGGLLPTDGLYYGHRGEVVLPAGLVEALTRLSNGGTSRPIHVHVHIGNEELEAYIAHVADDNRVTAERKGLGTRRLYV